VVTYALWLLKVPRMHVLDDVTRFTPPRIDNLSLCCAEPCECAVRLGTDAMRSEFPSDCSQEDEAA